MTQPTLINLHPNEYIQGLYHYPFAVNLDKCVRSYNTLNDLSNNTCVSLPHEKSLTFYNVTILIQSVFNKDKNNHYYNIFLEKVLYQLPKNNDDK